MTPTERTLKLLRELGFKPWPVERFNGFSGRRTDLFNIIDYLAITEYSTIGIQSCGTAFAPHLKKLTEEELTNTIDWLSCRNRKLILVGWRKVLMARGSKERIFKPRIAWLYLNHNGKVIVDEKETKGYGSALWKKMYICRSC